MDKKKKKCILRTYLGFWPAWIDLRKKEMLNDNIDIGQWQINMNYLISKHGSISQREEEAFRNWVESFEESESYENYYGEHLEENVTPILLNLTDIDLPPIFYKRQDRNWFLSAYPDVFEYFYPQTNYLAQNFDDELQRVKEHYSAVKEDYERMEQYLGSVRANQTIYLARMKTFYVNELRKYLLLCR